MGILATLLLGTMSPTYGLDNGLAQTPPMGWNSWNGFRFGVSEKLVKETIDAVASNGLKEAGYVYIVLDDGWQGERDDNDILQPHPEKFPSGIKALAEYAHSKGLKLGIYSCPNVLTCGNETGSLGYETIDAQTWADWGIDFLKYDHCPTRNQERDLPGEEILKRYKTMREALAATGRPIVYSIADKGWVDGTDLSNPDRFSWAPEVVNMWRTTQDIKPKWSRIMQILDWQDGIAHLAKPGAWNDPDMLEVGNGQLSLAENRAHFSLWCILAAPLMLGNDLRDMSPEILEILTNKEVVALNQDSLGKQGEKVWDGGDQEIFIKPLAGGSLGVVMLNRGDSGTTMTLEWDHLKLSATATAQLRDLWKKADLGEFNGKYSAEVASHDVVTLRVTPKN